MFKYIRDDGNRSTFGIRTRARSCATLPCRKAAGPTPSPSARRASCWRCLPAAAGSAAVEVRVWDVDAGKEAFALSTPGTPRELAFSPDGGRIAVGCRGKGRAVSGRPESGPDMGHGDAERPASDPQRRCCRAASRSAPTDGLAVVWHGPTDQTLALRRRHGQGVRTLAGVVKTDGASRPRPVFSADGRLLTCPVSGSLVQVWDAGMGAVLFTARGHAGTPAVGFGGGGTSRPLTAGWEGPVKEWAEARGAAARAGRDADVRRLLAAGVLACTPNGLRLARAFLVGNGDKNSLEVRIWDETGGPFRVPIKSDLWPDNIGRLLFNGDGDAASPPSTSITGRTFNPA